MTSAIDTAPEPTITDGATTSYRGAAACRFCGQGLGSGRKSLTHLLQNHLDIINGRGP